MRLEIHPTHPQARLIARACDVVRRHGVIIYPTDSCYALGCAVDAHEGIQRIRTIRRMAKQQYMTLVCRDLSELAVFAKVDNASYRLIRSLTPGPYTFVLPATRDLPRKLQDPKRKTVGLRIPAHPVTQALLDAVQSPLLSATAMNEADEEILWDPDDIHETLGRTTDLFIDSGAGGVESTTVIDLTGDQPNLVRRGAGAVDHLMELS